MRDGLVIVDKPAGWTSHDVVGKLRRVYGQRRVGHAGTLDPDATGVLPVGLGRVTRLLRFVQGGTKVYRGRVCFGVATDTLDAAGEVLERVPMPLEREQVEEAARAFVGEIEQLPPMVSAVKVGGRKLYEAARRGEEVERPVRSVRIDRLVVEDFEPGSFPSATVVVECSAGTYIRALAADLGTALGGVAHLADLRRLAVGPFAEDESRSVEAVEAAPEGALLPPAQALRGHPTVAVAPEVARGVSHGVVFPAPALAGPDGAPEGPFAVVDGDGALLAVYSCREGVCRPEVVLG